MSGARGAAIVPPNMPLPLPASPRAAIRVREAPPDPLSRFLLVDGHGVHCFDTAPGRRDLPAVLMVHGWCGSAGNFRSLARHLPPSLRCVAFDFPGHGRSDSPDIEYSSATMVGMIEGVHAALGLGRVDLVGHSLGGQLAVRVAHARPSLVRRLVLIDPIGLPGQGGAMLAIARSRFLVETGFRLTSRPLLDVSMRANLFHTTTGLEETREALLDSLLTEGGIRAATRVTNGLIGRDTVEGVLPALKLATLLVWGAEDKVLPVRWAREWLRLLPRATSATIAEAGHMPMVEQPAAVASLIAAFLQRPEVRKR